MTHLVKIFKNPFQFKEKDFITAGDFLVGQRNTSWSWESGDLSKQKSYLPSNKQFLILRNVPCSRRGFSHDEASATVGSGGEDEGWAIIQRGSSESKGEDNLLSTQQLPEPDTKNSIKIIDSYFGVDKKDDIPYMEKSIKSHPAARESTHRVVHDSEDYTCLRTYDISITYDNDLKTFHFWLTGYHKDRMSSLQPELILEDVRKNHVGKTVNIEDHPYLPRKHASVHPKKHRDAVKKMVEQRRMANGIVPEGIKLLSLYLEFVASVFPTIKFDGNMGLGLESSRQ